MQKRRTKAIFGIMLLLLTAFIPMGSVQAEELKENSTVKPVRFLLDGIFQMGQSQSISLLVMMKLAMQQ
ncbi:MAG: hypothetical protein PWQ63_207 [Methanolobus sp.]|jgi:hypothetical protein|nr:hypothetical protein [Methanolobus sp.]